MAKIDGGDGYVYDVADSAAGIDGGDGYIYSQPEEKKKSSALQRLVADPALTAAKGVIGLGESAVGLADIVSAGRAGQALEENIGYRPKEAKQMLTDMMTPEQQAASKNVEQAQGFTGTLKAIAENPSVVPHAVIESLPSMYGGAAAARTAIQRGVPALAAAAGGEGLVGGGQAAESIRQEVADGSMTPEQILSAVGSGVGTGVLGYAGGALARKLNIGDIDVMVAEGKLTEGVKKGFLRKLAEGGISEGLFEEMPQSMQEQAWQNFAMGRPLMEGVPEAGAMGLVTGAAMGGVAGGLTRNAQPQTEPPPENQTTTETVPAADALQRVAGLLPAPGNVSEQNPYGSSGQASIELADAAKEVSLAGAAVTGMMNGATDAEKQAGSLLFPFATKNAANQAVAQRDDAENLEIVPHPTVAGRFAIVPRPIQSTTNQGDSHGQQRQGQETPEVLNQAAAQQTPPASPKAPTAQPASPTDQFAQYLKQKPDGRWTLTKPIDDDLVRTSVIAELDRRNGAQQDVTQTAQTVQGTPPVQEMPQKAPQTGAVPGELTDVRNSQTANDSTTSTVKESLTPAAAPSAQTVTEPSQGISVEFAGNRYPVASIQDAVDKWKAFRETTGGGASEIGNGIPIYENGKQVARISYNGRVWDMQDKEIVGADTTATNPLQAQYDAAKARGDNAEMRRLAHEINQAKQKAEPKKQPETKQPDAPNPYGKVGVAPGGAQDVSLKDNGDGTATVMRGDEPFVDYDSGEDVTVKTGATPQEVRKAVEDAKAVSNREKWFGVEKAAAQAPGRESTTEAMQKAMDKVGADKFEQYVKDHLDGMGELSPEEHAAEIEGVARRINEGAYDEDVRNSQTANEPTTENPVVKEKQEDTQDTLRKEAISLTAAKWHARRVEALITRFSYTPKDAADARKDPVDWAGHQDFLETALENGEVIPQEVLDDYAKNDIKPDPKDWPLLAKKLEGAATKPTKQKADDGAAQKKQEAARRAAETDAFAAISANQSVINALKNTPDNFEVEAENQVKEWLGKEIGAAMKSGDGDRARALGSLLKDGKPTLPKAFYEGLKKEIERGIKAAKQESVREASKGALVAAISQQHVLTDAGKTMFKEGWDHALAGKTKSTLPNDALRHKGYESARAWMKTEDGAAAFSGKRAKKLENTGADLRRWFDKLKQELAASDDTETVINALDAATSRAELFKPVISASSTPGAQRWVDGFRSRVLPFKEWLIGKKGPLGRNVYGRYPGRNSGPTEEIRLYLDGERYISDNAEEPKADRIKRLKAAAEEYVTLVSRLTEKLDGTNVTSLAKSLETAFIKPGETTSSWRDTMTDQGKELAVLLRDQYRDLNQWAGLDSWNIRDLIANESKVIEASRNAQMVPPRLDRVDREGTDFRKGKNVAPQEFKKQFKFADVGFGKWVGAKQDQDHLNYSYDAFRDLAELLGIDSEAISLGGRLHFTIGALGHGKFAAHYQQQQPHPDGGTVPVINVTNTRGDGTVAHEWAHALDLTAQPVDQESPMYAKTGGDHSFLQRAIAEIKREVKYAYNFEKVRASVVSQLKGHSFWTDDKRASKSDSGRLQGAKRSIDWYAMPSKQVSDYFSNAIKLDGNKSLKKDPYWANEKELFARAFEAWVGDKLEKGNTYLVNPSWTGDGLVKPPTHRGQPYPDGEERKRFNEWFDALAKSLVYENNVLYLDSKKWAENKPKTQEEWKAALEELKDKLPEIQQAIKREEKAKADTLEEQIAHARTMRVGDMVEARPDSRVSDLFDPETKITDIVQHDEKNGTGPSIVVTDKNGQQRRYYGSMFVITRRAGDVAAPAAEPTVTTTTENLPETQPVGALNDTELSKLFDEAAAELQESTQEQPEAPAPGAPVRDVERAATADAPKEAAQKATDKAASTMIAEAAKLGVRGIDEAAKGLFELFGGSKKLYTFPGSIDKDTYAQAKPHFQAALKAFQEAGKTVKDLFKYLIENFGMGIKEYAIYFAKEEGLTIDLGQKPSAYRTVAEFVQAQMKKTAPMSWQQLFQVSDKAFGGTQAEGKYDVKSAYDAMEMGVNLWIRHDANYHTTQNASTAARVAQELTKAINLLPTQTKRTAETDEFQQFSTPPALSYVANWVAGVKQGDVMMEPSAGTGDLAIWSEKQGATLILNELSSRRAAILKELFPAARIFTENAEQLHNVLPADAVPTVVVMNPPFSATAGRVEGKRDTMNGAKHIEQALKRLAKGGRLVAIVGEGMAHDRPAFKEWWKKIGKEYNVRANIGISGKEYAKYGTTFDNQILVIDKSGPTIGSVVTGKVDSVAELPALLEGIRNDRPDAASSRSPATSGATAEREPDLGADTVGAGNQPDKPGVAGGAVQRPASDMGGTGAGDAEGGNASTADGDGQRGGVRGRTGRTGSGRSGSDTAGGTDTGNPVAAGEDSGLTVGETERQKASGELTNAIFEQYQPQRLSVPGAKPHPGKLVQSSAMASVDPPAPNYTPNLPKDVVSKGMLSLAQIEAVVYAGQAHGQMLPNGERRGFFIGDGTGVGKGREISGIILDNMRQGRNKAVWISFNEGLINDAQRDFAGVGGDPKQIFFQGKVKPANPIGAKHGILFTSYSTLKSGEKKQANDKGQSAGKSRLKQMVEWLGKDFDGVIVFDEAHSMGNVIEMKGKRGKKKPSQQAIAGVNLQKELPNARIVYVSATGATEISNLGYASRLGLWGEGTAFSDVKDFIGKVADGGVAAMELISRDMKALGQYIARSLSFDGVTYRRLDHELTPLQTDIYNELAKSWQVVLQNVDAALKLTNGAKNGGAKSAAMSAFWGSHQRFFNQIITSLQTPTVIDDMRSQIASGNAVLIQLVNTNEATQEREVAKAQAEGVDLEELDFTPRQTLMDYVSNSFPVQAYEESTDDEGNVIYKPALDSNGNPVFDKEAIAMRDALLKNLEQIRVPENPIDAIINAFGSEKVGEVTGRKRRFIQQRDEKTGSFKVVEEKRGKHASHNDATAFQNDKKPILIFSQAGGTGYSFHADNTAINQRKRIHYILQPGWRADSAVQGFGRSHRTNQATEPEYVLPSTNLKAQKRFVSSIARRLDQLGALTRGQRQATSQGLFTAADNLESKYASDALDVFFQDLYRGKTPLDFSTITHAMGFDNLIDKKTGGLNTSNLPEIPQFLNRLLSLESEQQDAVFAEFETRLDEVVNFAIQQGTYDNGLQTLKASSIKKVRDDVAYTDERTGAETRYVEVDVTNPIKFRTWQAAQQLIEGYGAQFDGWYKNKSGNVFGLVNLGKRVNSKGEVINRGMTFSIRDDSRRYIDNVEQIQNGKRWNHNIRDYEVVTTKLATGEDAKKAWEAQIEAAPKTETRREHLVVGVILPIWDRVKGHPRIYRLQTDDGERMIGRIIGKKDVDQTLKNLGLGSSVGKLSAKEVFEKIKAGARAVLANGWDIQSVTVSNEQRLEIARGAYLSGGDKSVLIDQGVYFERIQWQDRAFIPTNAAGTAVLERVIKSKPVVELFEVDGDGQAKEEGGGMFRRASSAVSGAIDTGTLSAVIDRVIAASPRNFSREAVVSAPTFQGLPVAIIRQAAKEGYDQNGRKPNGDKVTGVTYKGKVYVVQSNVSSELEAEETLLHERIHQIVHGNANDSNGIALRKRLNMLYLSMGGRLGVELLAKDAGVDISAALEAANNLPSHSRPAFITEEFLAHAEGRRAYETLPQKYQRSIKEWWGFFRNWLNESGFARLAEAVGIRLGNFTTADLAWTLKGIRQSDVTAGDSAIRFMAGRARFGAVDTESAEFKRWFAGSAVTDADGKPLVVYHGTDANFSVFDKGKVGKNFPTSKIGFYFTNRPVRAGIYADGIKNAVEQWNPNSPFGEPVRDGANLIPVYLSIENPRIVKVDTFSPEDYLDADFGRVVEESKAAGHDGIIAVTKHGHTGYVAFSPTQIKSAISNTGEFDQNNPDIRFMGAPGQNREGYTREAFAATVLQELAAAEPDVFRYQTSTAATIDGAMADIFPAVEYLGEVTRPDEKRESTADHRYMFRTPPLEATATRPRIPGKEFYVYTTKGSAWINVSSLTGEGMGSRIYAAVADFAFNSGRKFLGDPDGVSKSAIIARTKMMLSSALRHGTTKHLAASLEQENGLPDNGIPPLDWRGNDVEKVGALIHNFIETAYSLAPNLDRFTYDFNRKEFIDKVTQRRADFSYSGINAALGESQRRASRTGTASGRAAVLIKSLVSQEGRSVGDDGILRAVLNQSSALVDGGMVGMFNRAKTREIIGDSGRQYTPEQRNMFVNVGRDTERLTTLGKLQKFFNQRWVQGVVDQFAPFRELDMNAYTLMRLSKGWNGAVEAFLKHGKLSLRDGAYDADTTGGLIDTVFAPIGAESTDFLYWVAGNRAEKLMAEDRENLFTEDDISAAKSLARGETGFDYTLPGGKVTRNRNMIYRDTLRKFNEFHKNALDITEQSGLIDGEARSLWEAQFYVPFYRVIDGEDEKVRGGNIKQGLVRQEAFKKLKGGKDGLNDLLANTLMNFAHLIDASAKNRAAKAAIEAAENHGIASEVQEQKGAVWFMDGGEKRHFIIDDPAVMDAITGLDYSGLRGPLMDALSKPKHWLTIGVTASPFFKVRNLIRDSMQAIATSDLSYNPVKNITEGLKLTNRESQEYVSALAGGGLIRFGTMLEGNEVSRTRQLIKQGVNGATILDSENKLRKFYDKWLEPGVAAYNEIGNRGEEINRMALYDQLVKQGVDHATASLMARDLLDFSLQGSFTGIRFLSQVVPFFNARLQGLYKLGRASKENTAHMATMAFSTALFGLALMALYSDDDDWKKREEWDIDNYWWFKFGGIAYRIPKPFELGAVATMAERVAMLMFDQRMTGERFRKSITSLLYNQLAMNPMPQAVKPIIDIYANKDSFTGRPIEPMGMERLDPAYRYTANTTMLARGASAAMGGALSPVQVDHLVRAYFGWLGASSVEAANFFTLLASNEPTKPEMDAIKKLTGGMASEVDSASSRYVSYLYDQAKKIEQAYATVSKLSREGRTEEAKQYAAEHAEDLGNYRRVEMMKEQMTRLNGQIRIIERSDMHPAEKRVRIRRINELKGQIAERLQP